MSDICELTADDSCNLLTMLDLFKASPPPLMSCGLFPTLIMGCLMQDNEGDEEYFAFLKEDPWFRFVDINGDGELDAVPTLTARTG